MRKGKRLQIYGTPQTKRTSQKLSQRMILILVPADDDAFPCPALTRTSDRMLGLIHFQIYRIVHKDLSTENHFYLSGL
jgi:hypothetical protein